MRLDVEVDGTFSSIVNRLKAAAKGKGSYGLNSTGSQLVSALKQATPKSSGKTASSWTYKVKRTSTGEELLIYNTNKTPSGTPIPLLLNYGHITGNGGYVKGSYYISRVSKPILRSASLKLKKEGRL